jgi:predicted transcriptional regulator
MMASISSQTSHKEFNKFIRLEMRLDKTTALKLDELAKEKRMSRAAVIRTLIKEAAKGQQK